MTFAALLVMQKYDKRKEFLFFLKKRLLIRHASRATFSRRRRLAKILAFVSSHTPFTPANALSAGVQTMRARICSAISCDMFARVVWLKPRRAAKPPTFDLSLAACTCHAWLVRLTRARRQWFARRTAQVLLADFWYFWSCKSTLIKSILKYFSGHRNATPYKRYSSSTARKKACKKLRQAQILPEFFIL